MTAAAAAEAGPDLFRWTVEAYLAADAAGVFDPRRVELVNGDLWTMTPLGRWHGRTPFRLASLLTRPGVVVTAESLAIGSDSLPDPDLWVLAADAVPIGRVGDRVDVYDPADVRLVVEVSDTTVHADLTTKSALYARAGFGTYWVVTPDAVHVHTGPGPDGYRDRRTYRVGESVHCFDGASLDVAAIVGA